MMSWGRQETLEKLRQKAKTGKGSITIDEVADLTMKLVLEALGGSIMRETMREMIRERQILTFWESRY